MPFIYSDRYLKEFGDHIFPVEKYQLIKKKLLEHGIDESEFIEPVEATREQLQLVHTEAYLDDLSNLRMTQRTIFSELPLTAPVINLFYLAAGGTLQGIEISEKNGWVVHIGGGFHHAKEAKAEGFCYVNDLAVAARTYAAKHRKNRVLIIDLDLHQGNGTAKICQPDTQIYTFSMHEEDNYPVKEMSDMDISLYSGVTDEIYLQKLDDALITIMQNFTPHLILYQAGADPYYKDQLGNLALTKDGLKKRDETVLRLAKQKNIPIVTTLGGGYAIDTNDTVDIHTATCLAHMDIFS
ncbi:MAG: histone deacetylase [Calditrichaeota bacterium]|nr:MAG: histone deacetylase [Calditrichota bacterium]